MGKIASLKYLISFILIAFSLTNCQKSSDVSGTTTPAPTPPTTPTGFYSGYVPSENLLGGSSPRAGQLDSIGYVEDLDFSLISPFGKVTSPNHMVTGLPPVMHQGQSNDIQKPNNSCSGWAVGYGLMSYIYTKIRGNFTGSPSYIWNQLNGGRDATTTLPDALEIAKEQGCSNILFMPPFVPVNQAPSDQARENASHQTIAAFAAMRTMDIDRLKNILLLDIPIPVGINVDDGFKKILPTSCTFEDSEYTYRQMSGGKIGLHFLLVVGYDDIKQSFILMNSWGTNWGNKGYIWVSYNAFKLIANQVGGYLNGGVRYDMYLVIPQIVLTSATTAVTSSTAKTEGQVINSGGMQVTARGIVWSSSLKYPKVPYQSYTTDGSGLGSYQGFLTNLKAETKYYVRAYARRANGTIHYGEIDSFTTEKLPIDSIAIYKANMVGNWMVTSSINGNQYFTQYKTLTADGTVLLNKDEPTTGPVVIYNPPKVQESWNVVHDGNGFHLAINGLVYPFSLTYPVSFISAKPDQYSEYQYTKQ